jgi:hypothetical protein
MLTSIDARQAHNIRETAQIALRGCGFLRVLADSVGVAAPDSRLVR